MCQVTGLMKTNKYNSMAFRFNKQENLDGFFLNLYTPWEPSKHNYPHCRGMESSRIYTQLYIRLTSVSVTRLAYYIKMHHNILIFFITLIFLLKVPLGCPAASTVICNTVIWTRDPQRLFIFVVL